MPQTRERDRYARASLAEQAGDLLTSLRNNPAVVAIIAIVFGGWLVLNILTPTPLKVGDLATGDCIYIHAGDADTDSPTGRPAGSPIGAVTALYAAGAEKAPCDGSHSHEVVLQAVFPDEPGAAYPGASELTGRNRAACEAAFAAYVGTAPGDSSLDLVVAVPGEEAWTRGVRAAPCLVATADGQFLLSHAKGSAR